MHSNEAMPNAILKFLWHSVAGDPARPATSLRMPSGREVQRYLLAALLAAVPCAGVMVYYDGPRVLGLVALAALSMAAVEFVVARVRGRAIGGGALAFGTMFALLLPPQTPWWMVVLGAGAACLFGKEVFGGTGHTVFNVAVVGKAFLLFSFPLDIRASYFGAMTDPAHPGAWQVCAAVTLLGALAMLLANRRNWRILAGVFVGGAAVAFSLYNARQLPAATPLEALCADGFLFGACFLACDPAGAPRRHSAALLYGLFIGVLAMLMRVFSNYSEGMLSALLLGNLFAPVLDIMATPGLFRSDDGTAPTQ